MKYGTEPWVILTIEAYPPGHVRGVDKPLLIHRYDLPRELFHRKQWVPRWRSSKAQCDYPRHQITMSHCYYDRKTGVNMDIPSSAYQKWVSAKGMVTQITNKMADYKAGYVPTLYYPDPEQTDGWKAAEVKLNEYRAKVILFENQLKQEAKNKQG